MVLAYKNVSAVGHISALECVKVYQSVLVLLERVIVIKRERPGQKDKWAIHTKEEHLIAKKADVEHKHKINVV